jgi:hypothetical protein
MNLAGTWSAGSSGPPRTRKTQHRRADGNENP